jgi:hypothetical protein
MEMRKDQQRKEMVDFTERSVSSVINQVPQIMHNVLFSMGGYFNVTPL